jgi:hypothetical protein
MITKINKKSSSSSSGLKVRPVNDLFRPHKYPSSSVFNGCPGLRTINKANVKVKVKFSLYLTKHHAMETHWGGGIAQRILDLGIRRR